jgi:hypothetical protein
MCNWRIGTKFDDVTNALFRNRQVKAQTIRVCQQDMFDLVLANTDGSKL